MAADAILARGLQKKFGAVRAVDGMDLQVPRGATFGLIGENGAGKTTFIKLLLGIARPDAGSVQVLGGSPDDVTVRRRIGYLPERLALPAGFHAVAFLRSVGRLKGMTSRELDVAVPQALARVGLAEEAWTRRTSGFSKGMKQRTGLAAALLGDPELLVLDEPTDGIDPLGRAEIRNLIAAAAQGGTSVFLNSHLLSETERICDHVAVVARGRVIVQGPLSTLQRRDAFRLRFAAGPNVAAIALRHGFVADPARDDDDVAFRFAGTDAAALAVALRAALGEGLVVKELVPEMRDLESILRDAVGAPAEEHA